MTPRLKTLSGREVLRELGRVGFTVARTRGSHATLVRITQAGQRQVLTVPLHKELAAGTLHAIYRQASKFLPIDVLYPLFFHT
ncbi:hypothetical protein BH18ACI5_BH18ACI5_28730 [soil metagenome]